METVTEELEALAEDVGAGPAPLRERAAAGSFLASFYMGVENILKRIARAEGVEILRSDRWHAELFERFCPPTTAGLPVLFEGDLQRRMDACRRFRPCLPITATNATSTTSGCARASRGFHRATEAVQDIYGSRLRHLFLFGSHARGEATPESDVDLLVVLEGPVQFYDEAKRISRIATRAAAYRGTALSFVYMNA
jgi:hypothetical protein